MKDSWRNFLIILGILVADQLTKSLVAAGMLNFDSKILSFNVVHNTGAGFGILQGMNTYLSWLSVIALGLIMFFYYSVPDKAKIALILLAGGILSNLLDRIILGFVLDWIDFKIWPVFNIADSMIVIGVFLLIFLEIRGKK